MALALLAPSEAVVGQTGPNRPGSSPDAAASATMDGRSDSDSLSEGDESRATRSSVRPRGASAPISLRRETPTPESASRGGENESAQEKSARETKDGDDGGRDEKRRNTRNANANSGDRVWPMKPGDFDFTQAFGCVPQIANFYRSDSGCPGHAPVVHTGIDLAAPLGTRFYAAASGWVTEAGLDRPEGLANTRMIIQHDGRNRGYATEYLHWITAFVEVGDYVEAGQPIGEVGSVGYSTGPHLHFAVIAFEDDSHVDPLEWLPKDRRSGAYAGLTPGTDPVRYDNVSVDIPDYADPSPPPLPRQEPVPDADQGDNGDDGNRDKEQRERKERKERKEQREERRDRQERRSNDSVSEDISTDDGAAEASERDEDRERKRDRNADRERRDGAGGDETAGDATDQAEPTPAETEAEGASEDRRSPKKEKGTSDGDKRAADPDESRDTSGNRDAERDQRQKPEATGNGSEEPRRGGQESRQSRNGEQAADQPRNSDADAAAEPERQRNAEKAARERADDPGNLPVETEEAPVEPSATRQDEPPRVGKREQSEAGEGRDRAKDDTDSG